MHLAGLCWFSSRSDVRKDLKKKKDVRKDLVPRSLGLPKRRRLLSPVRRKPGLAWLLASDSGEPATTRTCASAAHFERAAYNE